MLGCRFSFKAYAKNVGEKTIRCSLKNYGVSIGCWWTCAYLSLIFIKVQWLQIVLRAIKTLDVLIFFKKKKKNIWCPVWHSPCPMEHLFYRTICLGLRNIYFQAWITKLKAETYKFILVALFYQFNSDSLTVIDTMSSIK